MRSERVAGRPTTDVAASGSRARHKPHDLRLDRIEWHKGARSTAVVFVDGVANTVNVGARVDDIHVDWIACDRVDLKIDPVDPLTIDGQKVISLRLTPTP